MIGAGKTAIDVGVITSKVRQRCCGLEASKSSEASCAKLRW